MNALWVCFVLLLPACSAGTEAGWQRVRERDGITVSVRLKEGGEMKEVQAVGRIDVPPWVCKRVVDDTGSFAEFMPYTAESRILAELDGAQIVYQRLDAPLISNRDYVMKTWDSSVSRPDGSLVLQKSWSAVTGIGPPPSAGVVRIVKNDGFWRFEELAGGEATCVTYQVHTDPGGRLPSFVVNRANTRAIPKLFRAVAARARDERYWKDPPEPQAEPAGQAARPAEDKRYQP